MEDAGLLILVLVGSCNVGFSDQGNVFKGEPTFGCGFNDNDLIVNASSRSPHNTGRWFRWKGGKIPYYFKGNIIGGDKKLIRELMDEVEAHTCFKYIHHNTEPKEHHLEIVVEEKSCANGFSAYVQPQSYTKVLLRSFYQLTDHSYCDYKGGFIHELMHGLGVGHTQRRADRDKYITVNKNNIQNWSQYSVCEDCTLYGDVPYDCSSIMHYGQGTFSVGQGKPTMEARDPTTCKLSWRGPAFEGDKKLVASDWRLLKIIAEKVCDMKAHSVTGYKSYLGLIKSCYSLYTKVEPYYAYPEKTLLECKTLCDQHPKCGAFLMNKRETIVEEKTSCFMIKPNNLFNKCAWSETGYYIAYEKQFPEPVPGYTLYEGLGKSCYSIYTKLEPYYAYQDKTLLECKTLCDQEPECGAFLMWKREIIIEEKTGCFMIKPNNLFIECAWSETGYYNAYKKELPEKLWRDDGRCGESYPLRNGHPGQCNPNGGWPCCSDYGWCGKTDAHCKCSSCINYAGTCRRMPAQPTPCPTCPPTAPCPATPTCPATPPCPATPTCPATPPCPATPTCSSAAVTKEALDSSCKPSKKCAKKKGKCVGKGETIPENAKLKGWCDKKKGCK